MIAQRDRAYLSPDDYLEHESRSSVKHEYEEYVLVSQDRALVECLRRGENDQWILGRYADRDRVYLQSLGWDGTVEELYEDVVFPEPIAIADAVDEWVVRRDRDQQCFWNWSALKH